MAVFCAEIKPQIQVHNTKFTFQFLEFIANLEKSAFAAHTAQSSASSNVTLTFWDAA